MTFVSRVEMESHMKASVYLYNLTRDPAATEFHIVVIRNNSAQARYSFPSETDCTLVRISGQDMGILYYKDSNHNSELDSGDKILMTDLVPSSFYRFEIIYIPTGKISARNSFSTPSG